MSFLLVQTVICGYHILEVAAACCAKQNISNFASGCTNKTHPLPYSVHQSSLLNCWLAGSGQGSEFFQVQGKAFFSQANGLYKLVDVDEACLLLHSYHLKNNVSSSASKVKITTTPILGLCMYLHIYPTRKLYTTSLLWYFHWHSTTSSTTPLATHCLRISP